MTQGRFSGIGMARPRRQTRRAVFLDQMTAVVPWDRFEQLIAPHYPVAARGRRPYPLRSILKFRHLLEKHELHKALFDDMAAILTERGLLLQQACPALVGVARSARSADRMGAQVD